MSALWRASSRRPTSRSARARSGRRAGAERDFCFSAKELSRRTGSSAVRCSIGRDPAVSWVRRTAHRRSSRSAQVVTTRSTSASGLALSQIPPSDSRPGCRGLRVRDCDDTSAAGHNHQMELRLRASSSALDSIIAARSHQLPRFGRTSHLRSAVDGPDSEYAEPQLQGQGNVRPAYQH
jgi:hypothetical protein